MWAAGAYGQTPVDVLDWVFTGDQPVETYTSGVAPGASASEVNATPPYTLNFNYGTQDNRELTGIQVGSKNNVILDTVDRAVLKRSGNAQVTGNRQLLWYDVADKSGSTFNISAKRLPDMETALTGSNISHGTDNVFDNISSNNKNNIERIDFLFPTVLQPQDLSVVAPSYTGNFDDQLNFGFPIIERGGNDTFQIAPILAVDSVGRPTQYGELLQINVNDWGTGLLDTDTLVVRGDNYPADEEYEPSAYVTGQSLAATFISLRDLGIDVGEAFYGYSLFGGDVDPGLTFASNPASYSNLLLDTNNTNVFPQNTSTSDGGLDLVSGGLFFDEEGVPTTGFVTSQNIPNTIPFHSDVLPGLLAAAAFFYFRLRKRLRESDSMLPA